MNINVKNTLFVIIVGLFGFLSNQAQAAQIQTGYRNIIGFGCHLVDGTCYFDLDGPAISQTGCAGNNFRFSTVSPNGKYWFSLISQAKAMGKRVTLTSNGCYQPQPAFPTFDWGNIE